MIYLTFSVAVCSRIHWQLCVPSNSNIDGMITGKNVSHIVCLTFSVAVCSRMHWQTLRDFQLKYRRYHNGEERKSHGISIWLSVLQCAPGCINKLYEPSNSNIDGMITGKSVSHMVYLTFSVAVSPRMHWQVLWDLQL